MLFLLHLISFLRVGHLFSLLLHLRYSHASGTSSTRRSLETTTTTFASTTTTGDSLLPNNMSRNFPPDVLATLELQLLRLLNLKRRPHPKHLQIHPFMLELYKRRKEDELSEERKETRKEQRSKVKTKSRIAIVGSVNTVRSHDSEELEEKHFLGVNSVILKFNVTHPREELLKGAELRLFLKGRESSQSDESSSKGGKSTKNLLRRVNIFDVLYLPSNSLEFKNKDEVISRPIDTNIVNLSSSDWTQFDIFPAVQRWIRNPAANFGLHVTVTDLNTNDEDVESQVLMLRRAKRSTERESNSDSNPDLWALQKPLLLTYTSDEKSDESSFLERVKRNTAGRKHRRKGRKDTCRRHSMYVDFSDVGWNDWIVAPPGYQAYSCQGECPFPLADHLNRTNHAIVQTLVNSVNPAAVPKACCVPTELSPISMLYVDEYDKVVLKNYQDMVVEGCGCR